MYLMDSYFSLFSILVLGIYLIFFILDIMGNNQDKAKDNTKAIAVKTIDN